MKIRDRVGFELALRLDDLGHRWHAPKFVQRRLCAWLEWEVREER